MSNLNIFDTKKEANDGAWLHLIDPSTKEPFFADGDETKPVKLKLLGANSDSFEKIKLLAVRKSRRGKGVKRTDDEELAKATDEVCAMWASMTTDSMNIDDLDGDNFTPENIKQVYLKYLDIRKQVGSFIGEEENFIQR